MAVDSHLLLGMACRKLGEHEACETHLRRALTICPDYPLVHAELGYLLLAQGRQEEHLEAVLASLRTIPSDAMWEQFVSAALAFLVLGRYEQANSALTAILETAELYPKLVPGFAVEKLQALHRGAFRQLTRSRELVQLPRLHTRIGFGVRMSVPPVTNEAATSSLKRMLVLCGTQSVGLVPGGLSQEPIPDFFADRSELKFIVYTDLGVLLVDRELDSPDRPSEDGCVGPNGEPVWLPVKVQIGKKPISNR